MRSLGFDHGGNTINLSNLSNHFNPVFTLTSDLHLGDSSIRPELTGARLGVELKFEKITDTPIHLILIGKRRSVVLIERNGEIIKNSKVYNGCDFEMRKFCSLHPQLSFRFLGCFPSGMFPKIAQNCFAIINKQPIGMLREHWLLLASTSDSHGQPILYFYDSFIRPVWFPSIYKRAVVQTRCQIKQIFVPFTQKQTSSFCRFYCLHMTHCNYSKTNGKTSLFNFVSKDDILQFVTSNFVSNWKKIYALR